MQALNALAASAARLDAADRRAAHVLGQALRHDPEPQVRLTAIRGLGRVGGVRARVYLQHATLDLDPDVATAAAEALASWPGGGE
jgi:HEAT repeat protein